MPRYLSPKDVADITGFSLRKVRDLIRSGRLPAANTSAGANPRYLIAEADLYRLLEPVTSHIKHGS